jgi:hypothetical protein
MGRVVSSASTSLDGFVAFPDDTVGPLFDWDEAGDVEVRTASPGLTCHMTPASADYWRAWTGGIGALVVGRRLFDLTGGWGGTHPLGVAAGKVAGQCLDAGHSSRSCGNSGAGRVEQLQQQKDLVLPTPRKLGPGPGTRPAIIPIRCTRRKSPHTKAYRALVSSLAPSVRPRCQAAYSAQECRSR